MKCTTKYAERKAEFAFICDQSHTDKTTLFKSDLSWIPNYKELGQIDQVGKCGP